MNHININGQVLPATADNVQYALTTLKNGGGLFETILMQRGIAALWPYHLERLLTGLMRLGYTIPASFNADALLTAIHATAVKNNLENLCRVRLQVFNEDRNGIQYIVECFPVRASLVQLNTTGLELGLAPDIRKINDSTANLKSWNAVLYETAVERAETHDWDDVLIYNTSEHIIESTKMNVFWIKENNVFTPPLSDGCVAGVMRRYLLEQLPAHGYSMLEAPLTKEILKNADAVFLTNAVRRIKWARFVDDTEYNMNMIPAIYDAVFPQ